MDISELRALAAKEGISLNFTAKDEMLSIALVSLQGFDDLILKGGTAINRVYIKNKRFSEDIDFDLIFKGGVKEALERAREIVKNIKGFEIRRPRIMKGTIRYDLYFVNPLNHKDRIRIEFKPVKAAIGFSRKIVGFGFVPHETALMNVYDIEKIILQKMDCILHRMEGKDFFDIFYLMDMPHMHMKELKSMKQEIIARITLEEKQISAVANVVNHYIPREERPSWDMFLEELKEKIQRY